ncbi:major facilitator superfamily domain-containing protein [Talaromyces proteolyticus]|uniref:Major facilitator superfamily domain-containing protein n=1 Tax=Talaromyces proteolyticus TaxID=1131652 RepID=A0AAD4L3B2_9EURO|nr:major facilitator superfamily domain-containing protein [Talaromyces proteolyticus]KAH8705825.1 major facilitator superfamily domain-containing protein [Talaromyces proteolyticus]
MARSPFQTSTMTLPLLSTGMGPTTLQILSTNWPQGRKLFIIFLVSAVTFNISLAATIFAPGVPKLMREFNSTSTSLSSFVVSAYIVSFILGPLVFAPLSELYGRSINMPMFIVFRLLQGLSGSVPIVLGAGIIGDLMAPEHRGQVLSGWQLGPLLGPVLGPVIGGYMAENVGWRWVFWLVAILAGIFTVVNMFVPEAYAPAPLGRKAAKLRKESGDFKYVALDLMDERRVRCSMLFLSPIVMLLFLETSIVYGYLYLLFTTFTYVFKDQYGFGSGAAGLAYLGLGVGILLGLFLTGLTSDRIRSLIYRHGKPGSLQGFFGFPSTLVRTHWIAALWRTWVSDRGQVGAWKDGVPGWFQYPHYSVASTVASCIYRVNSSTMSCSGGVGKTVKAPARDKSENVSYIIQSPQRL